MNESSPSEAGEGRYIYCVGQNPGEHDFDEEGVNDNPVHTTPFQDVLVVVHTCDPEGYDPEDDEEAKGMVFDHNYIIDKATERFGTVLPFGFNSIIDGGEKALTDWMEEKYSELQGKLDELQGKSEYTVQVFCDESALMNSDQTEEEGPKEEGPEEEMSKGMAYLQKRKQEKKESDRAKVKMESSAKEYGQRIEELVDEMKEEGKPKLLPDEWEDEGKVILNLSCLLHEGSYEELGEYLEKIDNQKEFSVRFTGPWAPFSFTKMQL